MGSKAREKALLDLITQMKNEIAAMKDPKNNPAQNYLTQEALAGGEFLKKGEFSSLPKGMFFDFQQPAEEIQQYKKLANVNQGGTFALAGNSAGGMGQAQATQKNYLTDRFARDASQNYQNNISNAAGNIRGALGAAAGAKDDLDSRIISAIHGAGSIAGQLKPSQSKWGSVLGAIGGLGGAAISKW